MKASFVVANVLMVVLVGACVDEAKTSPSPEQTFASPPPTTTVTAAPTQQPLATATASVVPSASPFPSETASPTTGPSPATPSPEPTGTASGTGLVIEWQAVSDPGLGSVGELRESAAVGSRIVVVGERTEEFEPAIWTSGNGRSWELADFPDAGQFSVSLVDVAGVGPGFVIIGQRYSFIDDTADSWVYLSSNGRSWARVDPPAFVGSDVDELASGGPFLVASGTDGAGQLAFWTSTNGADWEAQAAGPASTIARGLLSLSGSPNAVWAVRREPDAARAPIELWRTADGMLWEQVTEIEVVGPVGEASLAVGAQGMVLIAWIDRRRTSTWEAWSSADGAAWAPAVNGPTDVTDIFADEAGFIAVGHFYPDGGCAYYEADVQSETWTSVDGTVWRQMPDEDWFGRQIDLLRRFDRTLIGIGFDWLRHDDDIYRNNGAVWTAQLPDLAIDSAPAPAPNNESPQPGCG